MGMLAIVTVILGAGLLLLSLGAFIVVAKSCCRKEREFGRLEEGQEL